jgi:hypothetical protein
MKASIVAFGVLGVVALGCDGGANSDRASKNDPTGDSSGSGKVDTPVNPSSPSEATGKPASPSPQSSSDDGEAGPGSNPGADDPPTTHDPVGEPDGSGSPDGSGGAGSTQPSDPSATTETTICRQYFEAICARIRECDAPTFRPCESPADLCPDALFSEGSTWTIDDVNSCIDTWKTQSCDDLMVDQWPACSLRAGERGDGSACVFDAQCQSATCIGGIIPGYQLTCGRCAQPLARDSACDQTTGCPHGQHCESNLCVDLLPQVNVDAGSQPVEPACDDTKPCLPGQECRMGSCVGVREAPLPLNAPCSEFTKCEDGLVCEIELVPDDEDEPDVGTCQLKGTIGGPCTPTFVATGACEEGGTCDGRPTGQCFPLVEVGGSCGYKQCVEGAFCQVLGIDEIESYLCYERFDEGEQCYIEDYDFVCKDGLECNCPTPGCQEPVCVAVGQPGDACDQANPCAAGLTCRAGACQGIAYDPNAEPAALGEPCARGWDFGRVAGNCYTDDPSVECLCVDSVCSTSYCAAPVDIAGQCDSSTSICRQGLRCDSGSCVPVDSQGILADACGP